MTSDTKQAEKAYLTRAGTTRWEHVKPFSSPGHDDIDEGWRLIHDFAMALATVRPTPGARILDLGAGSCWVSEWLTKYNLRSVSVDIAADLLAIGRARLGHGAWIVVGDLEQLPFGGDAFDCAMCLNALHHVPDTDAALGEVRRVLRPGGSVVFSEPGHGHATAVAAQAAAAEFGVQERELPPTALMDACRRAGFSRVVLKPLTAAVPWYEVEAGRWRRWHHHASIRRPRRALGRIGRALLEGLGLGKGDLGFEDALGVELIRILDGAMHAHPFIVATK